MNELPRVLFVARMRYRLPLPGWLAKKWDAVEEQLDYRILASADRGSPLRAERFRLCAPGRPRRLDGILFYLRLPLRVRRELRAFRPAAIFASDPFVGAAALVGRVLGRSRTPVIVEVHGDWRTFTRLYGSPARRLLAAPADRLAEYAVRHADATRAVSTFTARLVEDVRGRPPSAVFTAFSDLSAFAERPPAPLPSRPTVAFVGALEHYKNIDGLAAAWRLLAERVPDARLVVVGRGSRRRVVDLLVADYPDRVAHHEWLEPDDVSAVLDNASLLALPSWPEGLGRVVIEAFARGRAVVATDAGGIPDLVTDEVEGLLVPPADVGALATAIERVLADRTLAERLGAAARARYAVWHSTPEDLAAAMRSLVDRVVAGTAR
jgi:glycosyltransferase involved in cell wall biosynthesis